VPATPILGIAQLTPNQAQKEVTLNDAIAALEAAGNATMVVSFAGGSSVALSENQFTRSYLFKATAATGASTLIVPAVIAGNATVRMFAVRNDSGQSLTVRIAGSGTTVTIPNGSTRLLSADGEGNLFNAAEAVTVSSLLSLPDVPDTYAGKAGKVLRVNDTENGVDFGSAAGALSQLDDVDTTAKADGRVLTWNAVAAKWIAAAVAQKFSQLSDCPSSYAGAAGKYLRVKATADGIEFTDAEDASLVSYPSASYWRILVTGVSSQATFVSLAEIAFLDKDGVDRTSGGTPSASSARPGSAAFNAFDNNDTSAWGSTDGNLIGAWISYQFAAPVEIRAARLRSLDGLTDAAPTTFTIQRSDDGQAWTDVGARTAALWADTATQTFPVNGVEVAGLPAGGQTGQVLKKNSNNDFDAAWAADSGGIPDAPSNGTKYVRKDGGWVAETTAATYTDEQVRDVIGATLVQGTGVTIAVDDNANTITISASGGGSTYTDENARDAIAAALVQGTGITITVNDGGDTITIARTSDLPSLDNSQNKILAVNADATGVEWVTAPVGGGGGGGGADSGPWEFARVRMRRDGVNGAYPGYLALNEVSFETAVDSGRLPGVWSRSDPSNVFPASWTDGNPATGDEQGGNDVTLVCEFDEASAVGNLKMVSHGYAVEFPNMLDISVSHDGLLWYDVGVYRTITSNTAGEVKNFALTGTVGNGSGGGGGGGIEEAPLDGKNYVRNNAAWVEENSDDAISPHGAHAYWRILIDDNDNPDVAGIEITEIQFRATAGGADQATGGVASASNVNGAGFEAPKAFDDNDTTYWRSTYTPGYISYHFAAPVEVQEIAITASPNPLNAPKNIFFQYSDDGSVWLNAWTVENQTAWMAGEQRVFFDPAVGNSNIVAEAPIDDQTYGRKNGDWVALSSNGGGPGGGGGAATDFWSDPHPLEPHRYWRMVVYMSGDNNPGYCYPAGFIFMDAAGNDLVTGTTYSLSVDSSDPKPQLTSHANGYVAMGALPANIKVDFGEPVLPAQFMLRARNDFQGQMPSQFGIEYSDDNVTWTEALFVNRTIFASGAEHVFKMRPYITRFTCSPTDIQGNNVTLSKIKMFDKDGALMTVLPDTDRFTRGMYHGVTNNWTNFVAMFDGGVPTDAFYGNFPYVGFEFRFPNEPDFGKFSISNRPGFASQGPVNFRLCVSRDGRRYRTYFFHDYIFWAIGRTLDFDISESRI
jgi:hypothetical protein